MSATTIDQDAGGVPTGHSALSLQNLSVPRGNRDVVRNVTIEIPAGEVTTLLGPNGAGKSSLVLSIGGVIKPSRGKIVLDGKEITGWRPEKVRRAGVAVVPEGRRMLPDLTVEDNLRVAGYSLSKEEARSGFQKALELFPELEKLLPQQARALSGGEQQMLVLAQALVTGPRFICIDELSLGLAPVIVQRLIPVIRAVADGGVGVLLIEQFATIALGLANRAYVMLGGNMQYAGSAAELREHPEMLQSAYLLRGQEKKVTGGAPLDRDGVPVADPSSPVEIPTAETGPAAQS
jgi:branched-chain amino acid transport system ATP-binding protein